MTQREMVVCSDKQHEWEDNESQKRILYNSASSSQVADSGVLLREFLTGRGERVKNSFGGRRDGKSGTAHLF